LKLRLLFIILGVCFLGSDASFAQKKVDTTKGMALLVIRKIDSLYPRKIDVKWSNIEKGSCKVTFCQGAYFYNLFYNSYYPSPKNIVVDSIHVPIKVLRAFDSLYPQAYDIYWGNDGRDSVIGVSFNCHCSEDNPSIDFNSNGTILRKNKLIATSKSPKEITVYLKEHYKNEIISNMINETTNNQGKVIKYTIKVDGMSCDDCAYYWVTFDDKGTFISEKFIPAGR